MSAVGYSSPFVPAEWIAAHGLRPERLRLRPTEKLTRGICPYAGALMEAGKGDRHLLCEAPGGPFRQKVPVPFSCLVLATTCDQMRYVATMLEQRADHPIFLLNVPSTWQTPAARQLYLDELRRLGRFLVRLGGSAPSDLELAEIMLASNRKREEDRENSRGPTARGELSRWGDSCTVAPRDGSATAIPTVATPTVSGIPLAILGGPLLETDCEFFALVERAGGRIVLDATEHGVRTFPRPFDAARAAADPLQELADAYFDGIPDAFRRPNTALYEWLGRELAARQVRGIILHRYVWCDLWHAESQRLKQWSPTPLLELDVGPDDTGAANRLQGRIEAFLEMLKVGWDG
jgi:benzoyl-CoA reductase/2-hydroxyglutaryl-CoA dehydratase subunit BcrC/BadD/HgdB